VAFRNWKQELEDQRPPKPSPWPLVLRCSLAPVLLAGITCGALWGWPGYLRPKPWVRPGPPPKAIVLVFSSDLRGYIEPCGCTAQRWGGVARLAGAVSTMNRPSTRFLLDVGDMTSGPRLWQQAGMEHYLAALGRMKYMAANLGAAEATMTAADLRAMAARSPVPLVSANLVDAHTGLPLAAPFCQVLVDNLRVTAVGVTSPDADRGTGEGVRIADIDECLGRLLPSLRGQTDLIVLLAGCDEPTMREIARRHPELDVILGGRVAQASRQIETVGSCRLAWHANKGQMVGRMDIAIRPDGRPDAATSVVMVLDNDVPEDPALAELSEQYNAQLASLNRQGGLKGLGVPVTEPPRGNTYAGSEACRSCHAGAYQVWVSSRHARAYASLVKRQRDSNPDCVSCHVVDLGAGDGFVGAGASPQRTNVQCESCHGRSGDHVEARRKGADAAAGRLSRVLPKSCETCHDCLHSPQFSYTPYWEKVQHGLDEAAK
jgi:hypothetical protein